MNISRPVIRFALSTGAFTAVAALVACTPRVQIEAPKDPIVINLNVKIEQEVRIKIDRELDQAIESNPNLF